MEHKGEPSRIKKENRKKRDNKCNMTLCRFRSGKRRKNQKGSKYRVTDEKGEKGRDG